ncbi:MAG: hypothetical protein IRY85_04600 [Micromonosporaceae bacterium]|nr:hypothetical protein [Micromonosporaceae bacterium]
MSTATNVSLTPKLSLTQIAVLSALMVEARELSNAELAELAGTPLTGEDRVRLVAGGLVEERRVGRSYAFQLSNQGWAQGLAVLAEQAQGKGAAATTVRMLLHGLHRALAARGVDARTFFAASTTAPTSDPGGSTVSAVPATTNGTTTNGTTTNGTAANGTAPQGAAASGPSVRGAAASAAGQPAGRVPEVDTVEQRIRAAYASLATEPAGWVSLADLRERLADIPRAELDTALKWMAVQPGVRLIPVANQKSLSTRDREAALRFGGEENHAFAIEES